MSKDQYLRHCKQEAERWQRHYNNYEREIKDAKNKIAALGPKPAIKSNSNKANKVTKTMKTTKQLPEIVVSTSRPIPQAVEDYGKTLGQDYKLVTHTDSKGNRIYAFEKDGKPAQVITQLKGQNPSKPLEVKSEGMIALVGQIAEAKKAQNSDFAELIGRINDQPTRDVINGGPKIKSEIKLPHQTPEIKIPEKIQTKPRVEVVYKTKKSGKQGKPQAIVLHDVNGKQFVLTPEIMENLAKKNKSSFFEKDMSDGKSRAEHTFKQYVEHIEKGDINMAGAVASFFKSEAEKPQMLTDAELKQQRAIINNTARGM